MSLRHLLQTTCTIKRPTFSNVNGIEEITVSYSNSSTGVPVRIEPAGTTLEATPLGDIDVEVVMLTFDINADIKHRDRVVIGSDTYEIDEIIDYSSLRRYFQKQCRARKKVDS